MTERSRKTPEERHTDVKAVARKLFEKKGFDDVTTKDIAEAAGLSRALIYRYNISKSDLLSEMLRDLIEEQALALSKIKLDRTSPEAMVFGYFERLFAMDMDQIAMRRLAVRHSWTWDEKTEDDFYLRMGAIFEPLDDPLREGWGVDLHEPARHALWAIYTESLRSYLARNDHQQKTPSIKVWRSIFVPSAGLVMKALGRTRR